ncbi:MAG: GMP synthase subunit A [Candidatus Micrarchaeota archaeon]
MKILIINLGSQYAHVIWRTMRDLGVEAVLKEPNISAQDADFFDAYIISGGPSSVTKLTPNAAHRIIENLKEGKSKKAILGICFGHQLIAHIFGAQVQKGSSGEYGISEVEIDKKHPLFEGVPKKIKVWESHFDEIKSMPSEFEILAHSQTCKIEAFAHKSKPIYGVQFHPEVWHTEHGEKILENFLNLAKKSK